MTTITGRIRIDTVKNRNTWLHPMKAKSKLVFLFLE